MKIKHTARGFQIIEFKDHNEEECSLQQSSLALVTQAGAGAIWLGINENRMHIDYKQLKKLLPHLIKWSEEGVF